MKVAILGYGVEGREAYIWWGKKNGHDCTIFDENPDLEVPEGVKLVSGSDWKLDGYDLLVRSPGIRPDRLPEGANVTSVMKEFMAKCPAPIIGVTGTKGKGTTCSLIFYMLREAGKCPHIGGNIGYPPLLFLEEVWPTDYVVLELSSFQLMDLTQSPQVAVCLMIVPEHLNWHPGMGEYTEAKANIFKFQSKTDKAVFNAKNQYSKQIAQLSKGAKIPYLDKGGAWVDGEVIRYGKQEVCKVSDVALLGPHNLENICAAITAVWDIIGDPEPIRKAISGFTGLEHRLELVVETDGVRYYNDSFSTTPETAIAAIQAFNEPKVLILGGSDKGSDYTALAAEVADANIKQVILIGDSGNSKHSSASPKLAESLKVQGVKNVKSLVRSGGATMDEVVEQAAKLAKAGDVVLLSPACASFDMFTGYKQRGEQFRQAVAKLAAIEQ